MNNFDLIEAFIIITRDVIGRNKFTINIENHVRQEMINLVKRHNYNDSKPIVEIVNEKQYKPTFLSKIRKYFRGK